MRWFQRTRGLTVDGIAGPETRGALVAAYMALDGTTLPAGTPLVTHGCGESFPLPDEDLPRLTAALDADDEARSQAHRRVELYFFDRAMGVQPSPPGDISPPGSVQYPEWVARARETRDFGTRVAGPFAVGVFVGESGPDAQGELVVLEPAGAEIIRRPLAEADHRAEGFCYWYIDPSALPATITAYWDTGDDALLVLDTCSPTSVSRALESRRTSRANALAFGEEDHE